MGLRGDKDKFLEWSLTATVISMFISMAYDLKNFEFVFVDTSKKQDETHQGQNLTFLSSEQ